MKKLLLIFIAAGALSACGDGTNQKSTETQIETNTERTDALPGNTGVQNPSGGIPDTTNTLTNPPVPDSIR